MSVFITSDCINCDVCVPECPNEAIFLGAEIYIVNPEKCTECVGHYDEPQCRLVCPVNCIIPDLERQETPEQLRKKFERMQQGK